VKGKYYSYFDNLVISIVTDEIAENNNDRYTYLYIPEILKKHKENEKNNAFKSYINEIKEDIVYVKITNFSKYTEDFLYNNKNLLKSYPKIIIDLRDNYGGDIFAMNSMVDMFLPRNQVIAKDIMRLFKWTHRTYRKQILKYDNIIILQNNNSASASENFIIALKENLDNVILIGQKTFGKGIGQYTLKLKRDFAVKATVMQWLSPLGINIHTVGINPDIVYEDEDIIEYSVDILNKK
jgi:C-terminal peptidase prc